MRATLDGLMHVSQPNIILFYITDKITFYVYVTNGLNKYILSLSLSLSLSMKAELQSDPPSHI